MQTLNSTLFYTSDPKVHKSISGIFQQMDFYLLCKQNMDSFCKTKIYE